MGVGVWSFKGEGLDLGFLESVGFFSGIEEGLGFRVFMLLFVERINFFFLEKIRRDMEKFLEINIKLRNG